MTTNSLASDSLRPRAGRRARPGVGRFASMLLLPALPLAAAESELRYQRIALTAEFTCEGAVFADLTNDGHADVVAGPYVWVGPTFADRREIYAPWVFDPREYSDNFAAAAYDFSGDGWLDLLVVGFPGQEAVWYENPRRADGHWPRHRVLRAVGNESAHAYPLTGDAAPELVGVHEKRFGFAAPDPERPGQPWTFHPVTPPGEWGAFTHGLGVGDIDGDDRADLLERGGWWRQPAGDASGAPWIRHEVDFGPGGAQMLVWDVNGDGLADVITSREAHGYGVSWFEQQRDAEGRIAFREHRITSSQADERIDGVQFSQPHALALADLDGDGAMDFVTGKRWWAHGPDGDPEPNAAPVLYAFLWRAGGPGAGRFVPQLIDDQSGVGTQIDARDVNGDGRADVVTANKRGTFVFLSQPADADEP